MEITTFKEAYIKELQENKDYLFSKEEAERTATKMIDAIVASKYPCDWLKHNKAMRYWTMLHTCWNTYEGKYKPSVLVTKR